jgi:hypothetical protein
MERWLRLASEWFESKKLYASILTIGIVVCHAKIWVLDSENSHKF